MIDKCKTVKSIFKHNIDPKGVPKKDLAAVLFPFVSHAVNAIIVVKKKIEQNLPYQIL